MVHCQYSDLKKDPEGLIRRIYEKLGREFSPKFQQNLAAKIGKMESQHKVVPYSHFLANTGLTEEQVVEKFEKYYASCKGLTFA